MGKSVVEKLWEVQPEAEIWWDSSPLVFANWRTQMIEQASDKGEMSAWLDRLFNENNAPQDNLVRGVTTNPPLSYAAIKDNPEYWAGWIRDFIKNENCTEIETVFWSTYKEIVKRGSEVYRPLFESSNYKYGYISGQVDPRIRHDVDKMVQQGEELHAIAPNVMVKAPGTAEGYEAIRILTSKGIATNNTLSFMIPQFVACMNAIVAGKKEAESNGVDLSRWRSVITAMSARYGTLGDLQKEADERNIELSETDIRWSEIAIFKKACRLVSENRDYSGKMLLCSMRMSPVIDGSVRSWHVEKAAGSDVVYTCPPPYLKELLTDGSHLEFEDHSDEKVPQEVMDKLMKIPYFSRGYAEDGYSNEEFNTHTALVTTANQFKAVTQEMVDFVAKQINQ
ncbi:MAG: transaldolase [SAR324 cluster bacterium]|nr:transaldolase [SAR324 cluster bacterium]